MSIARRLLYLLYVNDHLFDRSFALATSISSSSNTSSSKIIYRPFTNPGRLLSSLPDIILYIILVLAIFLSILYVVILALFALPQSCVFHWLRSRHRHIEEVKCSVFLVNSRFSNSLSGKLKASSLTSEKLICLQYKISSMVKVLSLREVYLSVALIADCIMRAHRVLPKSAFFALVDLPRAALFYYVLKKFSINHFYTTSHYDRNVLFLDEFHRNYSIIQHGSFGYAESHANRSLPRRLASTHAFFFNPIYNTHGETTSFVKNFLLTEDRKSLCAIKPFPVLASASFCIDRDLPCVSLIFVGSQDLVSDILALSQIEMPRNQIFILLCRCFAGDERKIKTSKFEMIPSDLQVVDAPAVLYYPRNVCGQCLVSLIFRRASALCVAQRFLRPFSDLPVKLPIAKLLESVHASSFFVEYSYYYKLSLAAESLPGLRS